MLASGLTLNSDGGPRVVSFLGPGPRGPQEQLAFAAPRIAWAFATSALSVAMSASSYSPATEIAAVAAACHCKCCKASWGRGLSTMKCRSAVAGADGHRRSGRISTHWRCLSDGERSANRMKSYHRDVAVGSIAIASPADPRALRVRHRSVQRRDEGELNFVVECRVDLVLPIPSILLRQVEAARGQNSCAEPEFRIKVNGPAKYLQGAGIALGCLPANRVAPYNRSS